MTNKQIRGVLRMGHIFTGVMLILFVYITDLQQSDVFVAALQWVFVPLVSVSGLALWQQERIGAWRRRWASRDGQGA